MVEIDEDILKKIILDNWSNLSKEDNLTYNGGPLYDIEVSTYSIQFRLSPDGCGYGVDINSYKMLLREKKLGELLL